MSEASINFAASSSFKADLSAGTYQRADTQRVALVTFGNSKRCISILYTPSLLQIWHMSQRDTVRH